MRFSNGGLTMAWGNIVELDIAQNQALLTRVSALEVSFNVKRSITLSDNSAEIMVYNASEKTRNNILQPGNNLILKAGQEDEKNIASIFIGSIVEATTEKNGVDWETKIIAGDIASNKEAPDTKYFQNSYKKGSPLIQVINDFAAALRIPVFGIENVTRILNNGFTFVGTLNALRRDLLDLLRQDGLIMYFDNSQIVIYQDGNKDSKFGFIVLSKRTGLIGNAQSKVDVKEGEKKKIKFRSLLNPKFQPNALVQLESQNVNGIFIVESVNHIGDNFGGDFFSDVEATE